MEPNPLGQQPPPTNGAPPYAGAQSEFLNAVKGQGQEPKPPKLSTQLTLSPQEAEAIAIWIDRQRSDADSDNQARKIQCAEQERLWREVVGMEGGEQGLSNFRVPLCTALVMSKHAREIEAFYGQNPSVEAKPRGPLDSKISRKVGLAMTWQVYENMRAMQSISLWLLRRLKHGRSFLYVPWERKYYNKTSTDGSGMRKTERVPYHEGPAPYCLGNDEIILPASVEGKMGFDTLQSAEWVAMRYWETPSNMLRLDNQPGGPQNPEGDKYQGIADNWAKIMTYARNGPLRDGERDMSLIEADIAEKVNRDGAATATYRAQLEVLQFHMKWRRWVSDDRGDVATNDLVGSADFADGVSRQPDNPKGGAPDAIAGGEMEHRDTNSPRDPMGSRDVGFPSADNPDGDKLADTHNTSFYSAQSDANPQPNLTFRDTDGRLKHMAESNLIVRYCPDIHLIVGVQDADEVYPDTPYKIPIMEAAFLNDGQYWCMGLIELTYEFEREMTILANRIIQAVEFSIGPPVVVDPAMGEQIATTKYEPFQIIYSSNAQGFKQVQINPNVEPFTMLWQMFQSLYEQLTGITQMVMGRGQEQPNAPRTLGGQRLLMGAGDVRLALDMRMMSEDLKHLLDYIWDIWGMYGSNQQFFRVADGDAKGLFEPDELQNGFATIGAKEREGRYQFSLQFADDAQVREGKKQEALALMQAAINTALGQQDPVLQYRLLTDLFEAFGKDFTKFTKEPPPPFAPQLPESEWAMLLNDEDVHVHPQDNHQAHIQAHEERLMKMHDGPREDWNMNVLTAMLQHVEEHKQALQAQQQMQALAQAVAPLIAAATQQAGGPPSPVQALMQLGQQGGGQQQGQPTM